MICCSIESRTWTTKISRTRRDVRIFRGWRNVNKLINRVKNKTWDRSTVRLFGADLACLELRF
jgi:hypothetical protein